MAQFAKEATGEERWGREGHLHYCCFPGCDKGGDKGKFLDAEGVEKSLLKCGRCMTMVYCSREHQKADWKDHKPRCKESCQIKEFAPTNDDAYEEFKNRNFQLMLCISQSMLWGDLVRTHVLWMQVKEIGGGAIAFTHKPTLFALSELAGTPLDDVVKANAHFWGQCPQQHKKDRIAHIVWNFNMPEVGESPTAAAAKPVIHRHQFMGSGVGALNPLSQFGHTGTFPEFENNKIDLINAQEIAIARENGVAASVLARIPNKF